MPRVVLIAALLGLVGCAEKIGDPCTISTDCSSGGDRICDRSSDPAGYCTIAACEYDSCPGEAVCVRFYSIGNATALCTADEGVSCAEGQVCTPAGGCVSSNSKTCNPSLEDAAGGQDNCTPDEVCIKTGVCVPRTAEVRFCMLRCGDQGDCRIGYECRDEKLMLLHGGEPVPDPTASSELIPRFCAWDH